MKYRLVIVALLALACAGWQYRSASLSINITPAATLSNLQISNTSFNANQSGAAVGTLSAILTPPGGSCPGCQFKTVNIGSFGGIDCTANPTKFTISLLTGAVTTASSLASGNYGLCYQVSAAAGNSPLEGSATLTANGQQFTAILITKSSFIENTLNASVGTLSAAVNFGTNSPTFSILTSGTVGSTPCATNGPSFTIVAANLVETSNSAGTSLGGGSYPVCLQAAQSGVPTFQQVLTFTAGAVFTQSVFNNSSSPTPFGVDGTFPFHTAAPSPPGTVGSGQILVPSVNGTQVPYQFDRPAQPWNDGSGHLSQAFGQYSMRLPQLAAKGIGQIVWQTQSGSYNNTSACTVTCITANSNLVVALHNVGDYWFPNSKFPSWASWGMYAGAGGATSVVNTIPTALGNSCGVSPYTTCNFTATGCTVNPAISVTGNVATLTTVGSGCPTQGSGSYSASINTALNNGAYTSFNLCGIIQHYLQGPVADGWEVACQLTDTSTGLVWAQPTGPMLRAWVEDWKNADGSVYGIRVVAGVAQDSYVHKGTVSGYTYDLNLLNNGSCIRCGDQGAANFYQPMQRIQQVFGGIALTLGASAQMDWIPVAAGAGTPAALNSIVQALTSTDVASLHASHIILPPQPNLTVTPLVLTSTGFQNVNDLGAFASFGLDGMDNVSGWDTAGSHIWFGPITSNGYNFIFDSPVASDFGWSRLQNLRIGAAGGFSSMSGYFEPPTRLPVNTLPAATWTPPSNIWTSRVGASVDQSGTDMKNTGITNWGASQQGAPCVFSHYNTPLRAAYTIMGEEWMLQGMAAQAATAELCDMSLGQFPVSFGGTTYYNTPNPALNFREIAWDLNSFSGPAKFLPSSDPAQPYWVENLLNLDYPFYANWMAFTGTYTAPNCNSHGVSKPVAFTSGFASQVPNGYCNANAPTPGSPPPYQFTTASFMKMYVGFNFLDQAMLFPNLSTALNTIITNYMANDLISMAGANSTCVYNMNTYVSGEGDSEGNRLTNWSTLAANPGRPMTYETNQPVFETFTNDFGVEASPVSAESTTNAANWIAHTTATSNAAAGTSTINVKSTTGVMVGAIVLDLGSAPRSVARYTAPPVGTGAIPTGFFVQSKTTSSVTVACGRSMGCTSSTIQAPGVSASTATTWPLGTGNGKAVTFSGPTGNASSIPNTVSPPIQSGGVTVTTKFGGVTTTSSDGGTGTFTGTNVASGTVNYTSGAMTITYSVAPDNGAAVTASYNAADVLVFSGIFTFPDTFFEPCASCSTNAFAAGTLTKPMDGEFGPGAGEYNPSHQRLGAFPPPSTPQVSDLITQTPYVLCPDPLNPQGNFWIDTPGSSCSSWPDANAIEFTAPTASTWGFMVPASSCPPASGNTWEGSGAVRTGGSRLVQLYGIIQAYTAVTGGDSNSTAAAAVLGPLMPAPDAADNFWFIDNHF